LTDFNWFEADLAVVDVETTGLDAQAERVIEIAIVHMRDGEIIESWGQLVDPGKPIPPEVTKLTGIAQKDVEGQPKFEAIATEVLTRLEGKIVVAYNLSFDRGFISNELQRTGATWPDVPGLDPLVFARELLANNRSKKLGAVAETLGIPLVDAHRATDDATVAGKVLYAFRDRLPERLEDLLVLQAQWAQQQEQQMARWRRRSDTAPVADAPASDGPAAVETTDDGVVLGPAYIYGTEPDPLRFFYSQFSDVGSRR
jgi:DNA polymerase III epsilon subunit family exonuclease